MSKLNSLLTNSPLSRNIPWLQVPSIRMVTALGVAVTCLLHGSYPQEAQRNGEPEISCRESPLKEFCSRSSIQVTGIQSHLGPVRCHVECSLYVPPEVESLVICPLTVSAMFFVAIRSPEPFVPRHWAVTQGLHPCWRCKGTVCFSAISTFKRPPEVLGLWPLPSSKSGLSSNFRVGNAYGNLILTSPYLGDRGSGSGRVDASLLNFLCGRRETGSVLLTEDQGAPFSVFLWWRLFPFLGKDFFRPYRSYLYLFPTLPPTMSTCIKYLEMPKIKISLYPRMTFYDSFSSTDRWDYSKHGKLKVLPWRSPLQVMSHSKINIVKILQLIPHWCMMAISRFWFTVR